VYIINTLEKRGEMYAPLSEAIYLQYKLSPEEVQDYLSNVQTGLYIENGDVDLPNPDPKPQLTMAVSLEAINSASKQIPLLKMFLSRIDQEQGLADWLLVMFKEASKHGNLNTDIAKNIFPEGYVAFNNRKYFFSAKNNTLTLVDII